MKQTVLKDLDTMQYIAWSKQFSVYQPELDSHHREIIRCINLLQDAFFRDITSRECLREITSELVKYTDYHFSVEEAFMREHHYPDCEQHQREHAQFLHDVHIFEHEFNKDRSRLVDAMAHYLKNWFIGHIMTSDKKYAEYFKARGVLVEQMSHHEFQRSLYENYGYAKTTGNYGSRSSK